MCIYQALFVENDDRQNSFDYLSFVFSNNNKNNNNNNNNNNNIIIIITSLYECKFHVYTCMSKYS